MLAASRVLVGVSAQSIAAVEDSLTVVQFRALVIVASRGPIHLSALADAMRCTRRTPPEHATASSPTVCWTVGTTPMTGGISR